MFNSSACSHPPRSSLLRGYCKASIGTAAPWPPIQYSPSAAAERQGVAVQLLNAGIEWITWSLHRSSSPRRPTPPHERIPANGSASSFFIRVRIHPYMAFPATLICLSPLTISSVCRLWCDSPRTLRPVREPERFTTRTP
jgi:hypothetical protein